ncbi:MAG: hypothetical protein ABI411_19550, partial [Tahibacter sp.]
LAGGGVTGNDSDSAAQPADYANRGQNFPILRSAAGSAHDGAVSGTSGTMTGDYAVDLNSSANCDESE